MYKSSFLDSKPGDPIFLDEESPNPENLPNINDRKLKKILTMFKIDANSVATIDGVKIRTEDGYVTVKSLKNTTYSWFCFFFKIKIFYYKTLNMLLFIIVLSNYNERIFRIF